jgi:hypothetical protein
MIDIDRMIYIVVHVQYVVKILAKSTNTEMNPFK